LGPPKHTTFISKENVTSIATLPLLRSRPFSFGCPSFLFTCRRLIFVNYSNNITHSNPKTSRGIEEPCQPGTNFNFNIKVVNARLTLEVGTHSVVPLLF